VARGVDRAFRLFREDQVASVRTALHNAYAEKPDGPRPCVFRRACIVGIDPAASVPCVMVEFNVPERARALRTVKDKV
jgi:hypothetical protein